MKKNMGFADRTIRVIVVIVLATLLFTKVITGLWAILALAAAIVMLITSLVGVCPLYLPFGLNTFRKNTITNNKSNH